MPEPLCERTFERLPCALQIPELWHARSIHPADFCFHHIQIDARELSVATDRAAVDDDLAHAAAVTAGEQHVDGVDGHDRIAIELADIDDAEIRGFAGDQCAVARYADRSAT